MPPVNLNHILFITAGCTTVANSKWRQNSYLCSVKTKKSFSQVQYSSAAIFPQRIR